MANSETETEAKRKAALALLLMQDCYGEDETIRFLEQELTRHNVIKQHRATQRALLPAPQSAAADALAAAERKIVILTRAVDFYADAGNYRRQGRQTPAIMDDGGSIARRAFEEIDPVEETK